MKILWNFFVFSYIQSFRFSVFVNLVNLIMIQKTGIIGPFEFYGSSGTSGLLDFLCLLEKLLKHIHLDTYNLPDVWNFLDLLDFWDFSDLLKHLRLLVFVDQLRLQDLLDKLGLESMNPFDSLGLLFLFKHTKLWIFCI